MKTSIRIVKYKSWSVKSNPDKQKLFWNKYWCQTYQEIKAEYMNNDNQNDGNNYCSKYNDNCKSNYRHENFWHFCKNHLFTAGKKDNLQRT